MAKLFVDLALHNSENFQHGAWVLETRVHEVSHPLPMHQAPQKF